MIPFGLTNAPATFRGYINKISAEKLDIFIIVYLDDIFIYIESSEEKYLEAVEWVLDQLLKYLLYANLKKCRFYQDKMRFLGYIISYQGICMEEEQIKVIHNWLEP